MKRLSFLFVCSLLLVQNALAGPIGPIATEKRAGKAHLGVGYARTSADWETRGSGTRLFEMQQNQLFVELGMGLGGRWEGYARGGIADLTMGDGFQFTSTGRPMNGDDTFRPFASLGVKGAFFTGPRLSVGPFLQGTYHSTYDDENDNAVAQISNLKTPGEESIHLTEWWDVQGGLIVQGVYEGAVLYGGPLAYRGEGEYRRIFTSVGGASARTQQVKEEGLFGGFVGIRWSLNRQLSLEAEAQMRSAVNSNISLYYHF